MIGKNAAGFAVSFDVPKQARGVDQIGRPHDIFYQVVTPVHDLRELAGVLGVLDEAVAV
jgi:hypothetical protein